MNYAQALATLTDASKKIRRPSFGASYITRNTVAAGCILQHHAGEAIVENWTPSKADMLAGDWVDAAG